MGLKQEEFAEKVDLSCNYLSAIERDVKTPKLETLVRIMNELGVSADEILQDVVDVGIRAKYTQLEERMKKLPLSEQRKILHVVDVMVEDAEK